MSSSEDYLDSLLDSILGGGKPDEGESSDLAESEAQAAENKANADAGKAMSPDEIEEMLVSMGTLEGGEEKAQESDMDDMEAMLAFMNEHNASVSETAQADALSLDDLDFGENALSYESVDDMTSGEDDTETIASDDLTDLGLDDLSLDSLDLGEEGEQDDGLDAFSLDNLSFEDSQVGDETEDVPDFSQDDFSLDDLSLDDLDLGEDSMSGENEMDGSISDDISDFNLDALSLDDLDLGESSLLEETELDDSAPEEVPDLSMDDMPSDSFSLDDLSLDNLAAEEPDDGGDALMSEEEIDRLLSGDMSFEEEPTVSDEMEMEDSGEDDDLSALLAGMEHDDDLSEIHDLLGESQQGVADDDMLAMLEGVGDDGAGFDLFESDEAAREAESIRELTPEEIAAREGGEEKKKKKEKKKRRKLFGKKKGGDEEQEQPVEEMGTDLDSLLGEVSVQEPEKKAEKEKKPGFFARILDFMLESEEDDDPLAAEVLAGNDGAMGSISGENSELLRELNEEDKKGKKKKKDKKKDKKQKGEKGEKAEKAEKKEKKPKKEKPKKKKEKKENAEVDLFAPPEKKLSKKKVFIAFLFSGTVGICIYLGTTILPDYMQEKEARIAYDQKDYKVVYDRLFGKELKEQDAVLYQRSELILQMSRKLSSYENYTNLNMRLEALDALISGVERYHVLLAEAEAFNVVGEVSDIYVQILGKLSADFGVSEADALDIIGSEDDEVYSQRLAAIINGTYAGGAVMPGGRQDVLLEEEEIIERIDGLEEEPEDSLPEEEESDSQPEDEVQPEEEESDSQHEDDVQPEEETETDENSDEGSEE